MTPVRAAIAGLMVITMAGAGACAAGGTAAQPRSAAVTVTVGTASHSAASPPATETSSPARDHRARQDGPSTDPTISSTSRLGRSTADSRQPIHDQPAPAESSEFLDHPIAWPNVKLLPPIGTPRAVPAADAVAALAGAVGDEVAGDYRQPSLAVYTNTAHGTISGAGTVTPDFTNKLVWAFVHESTWHSGDGEQMGGMNAGGTSAVPTLTPGTPCINVALVDAATGTFLMGSDYCGNDLRG